MKSQLIDITLEKDLAEAMQLRLKGRHVLERALLEEMRDKADQEAREAGGYLRTDRAPEVLIQEGSSPLLGDKLLVASRWWVEVPEGFDAP